MNKVTIKRICLVLACIALIKYIFGGVTWGSFTDWVSALSTAGTLLVAYKAYKDAPQWIREKQNTEGFSHASKIMNDYDSLVLNLNTYYFDLINNGDTDKKSLKVSEQMGYIFSLESRMKSCVRWKIEVPLELYNSLIAIKNYYDTAEKLISGYRTGDYTRIDESIESLTVQKNSIIENHDFYHRDIKDIFTFNN